MISLGGRRSPPVLGDARADQPLISTSAAEVLLAVITRLEESGPSQLEPPSSKSPLESACSPPSNVNVVLLVVLGEPISPVCTPAIEPLVR